MRTLAPAGRRTLLTGRGLALAVLAALSVTGAALTGIQELYVVAATVIALLALSYLLVAAGELELSTSRQLLPGQVVAGEAAAVELTATGAGRRRSPPTSLREPFDGGRHLAAFALAPLRPGERLSGTYRLPPTPRGRYQVGPTEIRATDPFGLVRRSVPGAPASVLVVHPRLVRLERPASRQGIEGFGTGRRGTIEPGGNDFAALRPYRSGDDLRHVHWPSTARMEQLMVRQTDAATEPRHTVAVDLRAGLWDTAGLDDALAAAGSVLEAAYRLRLNVRLWTTPSGEAGPLDTGFGRSASHWSRVLEALATAQPGPAGTLDSLDISGRGGQAGDTLTVITSTAAGEADLAELAAEDSLTVVVFGTGPLPSEPGRVVQVEDLGKFPAAWDRLAAGPDRVAAR